VVEGQLALLHLKRQLPGRYHITKSAKGRMVHCQMDDVGTSTLIAEIPGKHFQGGIGRRLVLTHRE